MPSPPAPAVFVIVTVLPAPATVTPVPPIMLMAWLDPTAVPASVLTDFKISSSSVTLPPATVKSPGEKEAIPLLDVEASSPEIVIVDPAAEVSIPSPPEKVMVWFEPSAVPESAEADLITCAFRLSALAEKTKSSVLML